MLENKSTDFSLYFFGIDQFFSMIPTLWTSFSPYFRRYRPKNLYINQAMDQFFSIFSGENVPVFESQNPMDQFFSILSTSFSSYFKWVSTSFSRYPLPLTLDRPLFLHSPIIVFRAAQAPVGVSGWL